MWRGPACSCPDLLTECSPELPGAEISSNYSKIWKQNVHRIENRIYTCHNILLTFQTFLSLFPAAGCGMEAMMHCWHQEKGMWEDRRRWYPTSNLHYQRLNLRGLENTPSQIRLLPAVCCRRWDLTAALQSPAAPNQYPDIWTSQIWVIQTQGRRYFQNNIVPSAISGIYLCLERLRGGDPKWLKTFYALLKHFRVIENCMHSISKQMWSFNQFAFPLTHLLLTFWRSLFYVGSVSAMHCNGRGLVAHCEASKCIYWAKVDVMLVILSNWIVFKSKYREETF